VLERIEYEEVWMMRLSPGSGQAVS
jgi:hypothetical protein